MNDLNCKYSNGIVPYLYGELATAAATEFESHLVECQTCTDEFAAMSAARYEVYDWKKIEFDSLATPAIEIPYEEVAAASWVEKLRAAFSGWAMPAAAFGGVAIIVALGAIFVISRYESNAPTLAQQRESNVRTNENTNTNKPLPSSPVRQPEPATKDGADSGRSAPRPIVVNDTTQRRAVRTHETVVRPAPRATTTESQSVPRLNEFSEEEDNSLRLAELFEDIDTRE